MKKKENFVIDLEKKRQNEDFTLSLFYFIKYGIDVWEAHFSINLKASYTLDKDSRLYIR